MKHTKFFIFALVAAMTFSPAVLTIRCSSIFLIKMVIPEAESTDKYNTNKDVATANMLRSGKKHYRWSGISSTQEQWH